jgi:superfamily II DNA or RNA helicase
LKKFSVTDGYQAVVEFSTLYDAFQAAVARTDELRGSTMLSTAFYQEVAKAVFLTFYEALTDTKVFGRARNRLHVISAPSGSGKTTFTNTAIAALINSVPNSSALVVVEQIKTLKRCCPARWRVGHPSSRRSPAMNCPTTRSR